jgi:hypothetical protein
MSVRGTRKLHSWDLHVSVWTVWFILTCLAVNHGKGGQPSARDEYYLEVVPLI